VAGGFSLRVLEGRRRWRGGSEVEDGSAAESDEARLGVQTVVALKQAGVEVQVRMQRALVVSGWSR
jgi:hypothetical protein